MASRPLCRHCLAATGASHQLICTDDFKMACPQCGIIDEDNTSSRNTFNVTEIYGAAMNEDIAGVSIHRSLDRQAKKHDEMVNQLFDAFLIHPESRLVDRPCEHFRLGAKVWYERIRGREQEINQRRHGVMSEGSHLSIKVALAIRFAIIEANVSMVDGLLEHVKPKTPILTGVSRGDGSIPAPSLAQIYSVANKLDPTHVAHIEHASTITLYNRRFSLFLNVSIPSREIVLTHVLVMATRIERLVKMDWRDRLSHMHNTQLKLAALKKGKTICDPTLTLDDFVLDSESWDYLESVKWDKVLEIAFNIYRAQQSVCLWEDKSSPGVGCALFVHALQASTGRVLPALVHWENEFLAPFGTTYTASNERRSELRDLLVCWSTSFLDAGIPIPILVKPKKGIMGDGLTGFSSDKRRPIPENTMAAASAQVIGTHWEEVMRARVKLRDAAIPIDEEFTMAARGFADAYAAATGRPTKIGTLKSKKRGVPQSDDHSPQFPSLGSQALQYRTGRPATSSQPSSAVPSPRSSSLDPAALSWPSSASVTTRQFQKLVLYGDLKTRPSSQSAQPNVSSTSAISPSNSAEAMGASSQIEPYYIPRSSFKSHSPHPEARHSPTIEDMLAVREDSSNESSDIDSDDDDPTHSGRIDISKYEPSLPGLGLFGVSKPQPAFGFSIGPNGFTVETTPTPSTVPTIPVSARFEAMRSSGAVQNLPTPDASRKSGYSRKRSQADKIVWSQMEPMSKRSRRASISMSTAGSDSEVSNASDVRYARGSSSTSTKANASAFAVPNASTIKTSRPSGSSRPSPSLSSAGDRVNRNPSVTPSLRELTSSPQTSCPAGLALLQFTTEPHVGLLLREREQYLRYRAAHERSGGRRAPELVEQHMLEWVEHAVKEGKIPKVINKEYLMKIGIPGGVDPRKVDLGGYIQSHPEWSPIEALLRVGLTPHELPPHHIIHTLINLHINLDFPPSTNRAQGQGKVYSEDRVDILASEGIKIDSIQLERELDFLFRYGNETVEELLATEDQVNAREKLYLSSGVWEFDRHIPESRRGLASASRKWKKEPEKVGSDEDDDDEEDFGSENGSKKTIKKNKNKKSRINLDALKRLMSMDNRSVTSDGCSDNGNNAEVESSTEGVDEDEKEAIMDALAEGLWSATSGFIGFGGDSGADEDDVRDGDDEDDDDDERASDDGGVNKPKLTKSKGTKSVKKLKVSAVSSSTKGKGKKS